MLQLRHLVHDQSGTHGKHIARVYIHMRMHNVMQCTLSVHGPMAWFTTSESGGLLTVLPRVTRVALAAGGCTARGIEECVHTLQHVHACIIILSNYTGPMKQFVGVHSMCVYLWACAHMYTSSYLGMHLPCPLQFSLLHWHIEVRKLTATGPVFFSKYYRYTIQRCTTCCQSTGQVTEHAEAQVQY